MCRIGSGFGALPAARTTAARARNDHRRAAMSAVTTADRQIPVRRRSTAPAALPLTSTLGAEVTGLELGRPLTGASTAWVRRALVEHKVLFFRGQHLTPSEQVAFAATLGELTPAHPLAGGLDDDHPEVLVLDSSAYALGLGRRTATTSYNDRWHTDVTFSERPPAASVLCAEVIPPVGGDTLWADLEDAYTTLSPRLQSILDEATALHSAVGAFGYLEGESEARGREVLAGLDAVRHP